MKMMKSKKRKSEHTHTYLLVLALDDYRGEWGTAKTDYGVGPVSLDRFYERFIISMPNPTIHSIPVIKSWLTFLRSA